VFAARLWIADVEIKKRKKKQRRLRVEGRGYQVDDIRKPRSTGGTCVVMIGVWRQ